MQAPRPRNCLVSTFTRWDDDPVPPQQVPDRAVRSNRRHHVVVIGAGFGGLAVARSLGDAPVDVTLIEANNFHTFQPLLYQVATAALSPADIAWPIRSILSRQDNVSVQMGRVVGIDRVLREVVLEDRRVPFDHLVLATGARHSYFGMDEWEATAPGLKKIADATGIRERVLLAFERAEITSDPEERRQLLTFVVIGGGLLGLEAAKGLMTHDLASVTVVEMAPWLMSVQLDEAGGKVLGHGPVVISARESAMSWVKLNRCNPVSKKVDIPLDIISDENPQVGAETTREKWENCRGVELWTMHGGAHSPGLKHPEWPQEIVSWLFLHPKP